MISQKSVEEIKQTVRLVDVVSETVKLTRRGSNFVGLCPFHAEKTPSFSVNDSGNFYHCFGCAESGNVISWFMKTQGLSFPEALEHIAERYSLTLEYEGRRKGASKAGPDKKEIYAINMAAYKFYRAQLERAPKVVNEYLERRGLTSEVCDYFGIGFVPADWRSLSDALKKRKFSEELILAAALAKRNRSGELYDTFRARIIFPIWVDGRRIAGFGGRVVPGLEADASSGPAPKYINSPETVVYQKSSILYGLPQALDNLRDSKEGILVEGYLDVIALHRVGVTNAIATCGTALTSEHVRRLRGLVNRVTLLFDGDKAGRQAAAKSFRTFLNSGLDAQVLFLADSEDPDSIAAKHGAETFNFLNGLPRNSLISCYAQYLLQQQGFEGFKDLAPASRGRIAAELAELIRTVTNQIEKNELLKEAAFILNVERTELEKLVENPALKARPVAERSAVDLNVATPTENGEVAFRIKDFAGWERDLLRAVMVIKSELPDRILNDALIVQDLHPAILQFLEELREVVLNDAYNQEQKKEQIKNLLFGLGSDWTQLWKEAYQMAAVREVDMLKLYEQCRCNVQRRQFEKAANLAQKQIDETVDDELKAVLLGQKIELMRQAKALAVMS